MGEGRGEGCSNAGNALTLTLSQGARGAEGRNVIPLALRAMRPPQAVEVFCARDHPEFVRGEHFAGRVVHAAGPWRVHGEWWSDGGYARDYYDTQLTDGCVYRLYCNLTTRSWFVDGIYD